MEEKSFSITLTSGSGGDLKNEPVDGEERH